MSVYEIHERISSSWTLPPSTALSDPGLDYCIGFSDASSDVSTVRDF